MELQPTLVRAHVALAGLLAARGERSAAESHYREALRLAPDDAEARAGLARLLELPFDLACFGHGSPIRQGAKAVLRRFVEDDRIWAALQQERQERLKDRP